jgi:hypothetical protein
MVINTQQYISISSIFNANRIHKHITVLLLAMDRSSKVDVHYTAHSLPLCYIPHPHVPLGVRVTSSPTSNLIANGELELL